MSFQTRFAQAPEETAISVEARNFCSRCIPQVPDMVEPRNRSGDIFVPLANGLVIVFSE
jgi:hypothetical protein